MKLNQIKVGTYQLGHENVDLFALPDESGGEFYLVPDATSLGRLKVGCNYSDWGEVIAVLLHEALEYSMCKACDRYARNGKLMDDHADYLFVMDHPTFTQHCAKVGMFLAQCVPDLAAEYKKQQAKRKKK